MRHSHRSNVTGRWAKVDPEHDLVPVDVSAEDVSIVKDNSLHGKYAAPEVTDAPEAEPVRSRLRTQATGLRDPFGRVDQHLVERAQAGLDLVPGTGSQP